MPPLLRETSGGEPGSLRDFPCGSSAEHAVRNVQFCCGTDGNMHPRLAHLRLVKLHFHRLRSM